MVRELRVYIYNAYRGMAIKKKEIQKTKFGPGIVGAAAAACCCMKYLTTTMCHPLRLLLHDERAHNQGVVRGFIYSQLVKCERGAYVSCALNLSFSFVPLFLLFCLFTHISRAFTLLFFSSLCVRCSLSQTPLATTTTTLRYDNNATISKKRVNTPPPPPPPTLSTTHTDTHRVPYYNDLHRHD